MDTDLKCNRLTCRKTLTDKAVVTTCSHIFCVECANELFNAARLCPACEASLTEADDVVVCSLHPTNDYKTSVLSGLAPSIILEICSRAISFWQYQIYQESSFQQAVVRNLTDKNNQSQKQLDSVVREANNEISILNNKIADLERDVEIERRKVRDLQEGSKDRDREYQKLKAQHDKMKRKALLGVVPAGGSNRGMDDVPLAKSSSFEDSRRTFGGNMNVNTGIHHNSGMMVTGAGNIGHANMAMNMNSMPMDVGAVVGGMEANGIQRTPLVNRNGNWAAQQVQRRQPGQIHRQSVPQGYRSGNVSDTSSTREVENILGPRSGGGQRRSSGGGWGQQPTRQGQGQGQGQRVFPPAAGNKRSGTFRPAGVGASGMR